MLPLSKCRTPLLTIMPRLTLTGTGKTTPTPTLNTHRTLTERLVNLLNLLSMDVKHSSCRILGLDTQI